jgi:hypothetical protein
MKPQYVNGNMRAACPDCDGAITTFESGAGRGGQGLGIVTRNHNHQFEGRNYTSQSYILMRCAGCGRGGLATVHADGQGHLAYDERFYPPSRDFAPLPPGVPEGVRAEYREAELCASVGAWRAASALLRSALEKTFRANGYVAGSLAARIDEASHDGVITAARRQRAHDEVRVLGNDVMHDDWRNVTEQEYADAHHYVQRIAEDFYDQRPQVEVTLRAAGKIPPLGP